MSRDVTALSGAETQATQFPVSLVQFAIPGFVTGPDVWGTPLINHGGGYSVGAASLVVDGLGAGTIPAGAFFKLGLRWYTVTAPSAITAGAATLAISPALQELVVDNEPLVTLFLCINDIDMTVYLNSSTGTVSMVPGAGLVAFSPYADFTVPQIENSEEQILSELTLSVSNVIGDWTKVVAENAYRETPVTVWQGNLSLATGAPPEATTFIGVVKSYGGRLDDIDPSRTKTTITLAPHVTPLTLSWPYRTYSAPEFKHLPKNGSVRKWGFTETTY